MTARPLTLEDFGAPPRAGAGAVPVSGDLEGIKLDAFEAGYKDGWDDCLRAEQENHTQIGADLSRNIKDLSFTYHEARNDVLSGLKPLLDGIAGQLLPVIAAEALAPVLRAELAQIIDDLPDGKCEIVAAPSTCPSLETVIPAEIGAEVTIRPEPAYAEGHVSLRFGTELREIDLSAAADRIATSIRDFAAEAAHGPEPSQGVA